MKIFFYTIAFFIFITYIFIINDAINYKNTEWEENSPILIYKDSTQAKFSFFVTEPATIYWRVYTNQDQIPIIPQALTNTNDFEGVIAYGGNISQGVSQGYTNIISNLTIGQEYFLSAIAVSYIGDFPKEITNIPFSIP